MVAAGGGRAEISETARGTRLEVSQTLHDGAAKDRRGKKGRARRLRVDKRAGKTKNNYEVGLP